MSATSGWTDLARLAVRMGCMHASRLLVATLLALIAGTAVAALCPASAAAAGGPILPVAADGTIGIESPDGGYRYVTLDGDGSIVAKIDEGSGEVVAARPVRDPDGGYFGIPQVASDGSASGLSADGETLILIRSAGPINQAKLLVLGANKLRIQGRITLKGQYSFDAISPDGRTAYVVEYPRPFRYDRYRVLRLDLKTGRLAKRPIADEDVGLEEEEEGKGSVAGEMRGTALSRVGSEDGRWAYTLYDGGGDVPFIHALDTVGDKAVCVFLPELQGLERRELAKMTLTGGPELGTISVLDRDGTTLALVDIADFSVTTPADEPATGGAGFPASIAVIAVAALVAVGVIALVAIRRRRRRAVAV
jgi:hypothetical protein